MIGPLLSLHVAAGCVGAPDLPACLPRETPVRAKGIGIDRVHFFALNIRHKHPLGRSYQPSYAQSTLKNTLQVRNAQSNLRTPLGREMLRAP